VAGEVRLEGVTVRFGPSVALDEVAFSLDSPFFAVVMGPNGAGKTTLLKVLMGLLKPEKGVISVYGYDPVKDPGKVKHLVGYVPQVVDINVHVPITAEEVVAMGALSKLPPPRIIDRRLLGRVREVLGLVGLDGVSDKLFTELSGGQRQRVLIARALIRRPRLLLLDEPFSMLDFDIKCEIAALLDRLHKEMGIDVLLVAHELSPCMALEPVVILLNKRVFAVGRAGEVMRVEVLREAYPGVTEVPSGVILGEDHA